MTVLNQRQKTCIFALLAMVVLLFVIFVCVLFVCLFPFSGYFSFQSPAFHILSVILTLTISCRFTHTGSLIAALPSYP